MRWIASFLDAIFANLFGDSKFFANLTNKIAGSVEEFVYNLEAGDVDVSSLSRTMDRLIFWLPIVFGICLVLDLIIRSRFVRYSYQDEYQAKKSVWWSWQSDADAALALESGANTVQALGDGSAVVQQEEMQQDDAAEPVQEAEEGQTEVVQDEQPVEDMQQDQEEAEAQDDLDRGNVTSARQNQVRNVAPVKERTQGAMTDLRDSLTIFKGAIAFAPRIMKRNARLRKQSMKEEARHTKERMSERLHRGRAAKQREEAAQAEALFDTQEKTYVDADFEQNEAVNTGGINGVDFAQAADVLREAVAQQQQEAEAQTQEAAQETTETVQEAEPAQEQAE